MIPFDGRSKSATMNRKRSGLFCDYMVRSRKGIEMLVNLINISYCAMKILPYQDKYFSKYRTKSVQEFRFELSQEIRKQIFFATFVKNIETHIKSETMINFTNYNSSSSIKSINNLITGFVLFGFRYAHIGI